MSFPFLSQCLVQCITHKWKKKKVLVGSNGFSILISNSKSPKSKRLYPNNEIQILVKSSNNQVKGTTHTVNVTRSCLPGLKTQCAFTYPRGFHITARIILLESFKSPRNTSRLLPNSSKMKIQSRGSSTPPPWMSTFLKQHVLSMMPSPNWCLLHLRF